MQDPAKIRRSTNELGNIREDAEIVFSRLSPRERWVVMRAKELREVGALAFGLGCGIGVAQVGMQAMTRPPGHLLNSTGVIAGMVLLALCASGHVLFHSRDHRIVRLARSGFVFLLGILCGAVPFLLLS